MTPIHRTLLFIAILTLQGATQCATQSAPLVRGKIKLSDGWRPRVYLVQARSFAEIASSFSGIVLDSAIIQEDGSFVLEQGKWPLEKGLFQLCVQKNESRFANQLLDDKPLMANYMPLVLEPQHTQVCTAEAERFQASFTLSNPGVENRALLQLRDLRHQAFQAEQHWLNAENHADENTLLDHEAALLRFQRPLMDFADSSAFLFPALVAIRWVSPKSDYERVPEFVYQQCAKWSAKNADNPMVAQLCKTGSKENLPSLIGDKVPDFALPMVHGDTLALYQLLGKKITILDIWASWCAPCRRENRDILAPIQARYQQQGVQVLGYSIDSSPAAWKAAIAKDGAAWPQASHLSGDETPFLQALRINTIPANFILDSEGKILAKNLHGKALEDFLIQYFKQ